MLCQKIEGAWQAVPAARRTVPSPDGATKIRREALLRALASGDAETEATFAAAVATRAAVPEGKRAVGPERIEEVEGLPVIVRELEDVPFEALAHLADLRWQAEQGGTEWSGWAIPTDDRSQLKYAAEVLAVQTGARGDGDPWKLPHGFEPLTNAQVIEMASAARGHVLACFAAEAAVAAEIAGGAVMDASGVEAAFAAALEPAP